MNEYEFYVKLHGFMMTWIIAKFVIKQLFFNIKPPSK
jgi:hypothetical protein